MSNFNENSVNRFTSAMHQVWQAVGRTVSEAAGFSISFTDPATVVVPISEIYSDMSDQKLVIQFAFADNPENVMIVTCEASTVAVAYESFSGQKAGMIDDAKVSALRPMWEAIVQGICVAAGQLKGEPIVATGLTIRYQVVSFPPNVQKAEELIKTTINVVGEGLRGTFTWMMDVFTANGLAPTPEGVEEPSVFKATTAVAAKSSGSALEDSAFDLLLDVPLEISVELGRVRMLVKDIIELGTGSIVEIDKAAGEPVDVMVNGRLVARGEVVVIEDNFGVRITEILTTAERLASLNEAA